MKTSRTSLGYRSLPREIPVLESQKALASCLEQNLREGSQSLRRSSEAVLSQTRVTKGVVCSKLDLLGKAPTPVRKRNSSDIRIRPLYELTPKMRAILFPRFKEQRKVSEDADSQKLLEVSFRAKVLKTAPLPSSCNCRILRLQSSLFLLNVKTGEMFLVRQSPSWQFYRLKEHLPVLYEADLHQLGSKEVAISSYRQKEALMVSLATPPHFSARLQLEQQPVLKTRTIPAEQYEREETVLFVHGRMVRSRRRLAAAVGNDDFGFVWGGKKQGYDDCTDSLIRVHFEKDKLMRVQQSTKGRGPAAAVGASLALQGWALIHFGGYNKEPQVLLSNTVAVLDLRSMGWCRTAVSKGEPLSGRYHHSAVSERSRLVVFGGLSSSGYSSQVLELETGDLAEQF